MNAKRKIFIESFLKHESKKMTKGEIDRTRKEGIKWLYDGEFWFKVANTYEGKLRETATGIK